MKVKYIETYKKNIKTIKYVFLVQFTNKKQKQIINKMS